MLPHEYARTALQIGLQQEQRIGVNPFKFGMIGSTDAHTGMASPVTRTTGENSLAPSPPLTATNIT